MTMAQEISFSVPARLGTADDGMITAPRPSASRAVCSGILRSIGSSMKGRLSVTVEIPVRALIRCRAISVATSAT